ncbi:uncharacterized protein LOC133198101 [Saccostrea echinata]|uniref:uncharacterized protein LOC133198101 n=1 Tax=Saccostrea echinata TaxID=191078 RepID=UPI002A832952|nr:uncharacterized protein LOC133198101 [Saccostrea echinata]
MSLSKYSSTAETTNLARLARLILGPCTDVLREVLKKEILPLDLSKEFKKWINDPANTKQRSPFNNQRTDLIFPLPTKHYGGNYSDFDIGLLYLLLRNISKIPPHTNGWGKDPDPGDRSESANIERVRLIRNKYYGHINEFSISDSDFRQEWRNIHEIVKELELTLGTATFYEDAVKDIKKCPMDPQKELEYINKLAAIDELSDKVESLSAEIINLKRPIPRNVKVHEKEILKWEEEDKVFSEIHNYPSVLEKVKKQPCVVFVGVPGSGKTVMARHTALTLRDKNYEVVPVNEIGQMKLFCDPLNPQVFVLDDVVGKFGFQQSKMDLLIDYEQMILNPAMPDSKILLTCRETVYNKAKTSSAFFSEESNIFLFHSDENELNEKEKIGLMEAYKIDTSVLSKSDLGSASKMFPLLCKLFPKEEFLSYGPRFFECPIHCILAEFEKMYNDNKLHYASLVLCMINGSRLSEEILENTGQVAIGGNFGEIKQAVCKKLKMRSQTDDFEFVDALREMNGTYTKLCDREYTFIHDSMFEIIAHHFGQKCPDLILKYLSSSYIANYVKPQKCKTETNESESKEMFEKAVRVDESNASRISHDLSVKLQEEYFPLLAERLFRDIEDMQLYDVFMSDHLKYPQVCQAFLAVLNSKRYMDIKDIFLSQKNDQFLKLLLKSKADVLKIWNAGNKEFIRQRLLVGLREISENHELNIRVISWVIYYGHHNILRYIVDQTEQNKETQCKLFQNYETPCPRSDFSELGHSRTSVNNVIKQGTDMAIVFEVTSDANSSDTSVKETCDTSDLFVESTRLLVIGCYSGDVETVKILLEHVNENSLNRTSRYQGYIFDYWRQDTPLTAACGHGHEDVVRELINRRTDVNLQRDLLHVKFPLVTEYTPDRLGLMKQHLILGGVDINIVLTPLVSACKGGHYEVVKELLKAGSNVNTYSVGESPLIAACKGGYVNIVNELLKSGAEVNPKNEGYIPYQTPLSAACYHGHLNVVKLLLKEGAEVSLHGDCYSPLSAACENGHLNVAKELLKFQADVNHESKFYEALKAAKNCSHNICTKKQLRSRYNFRTRRGNRYMYECDIPPSYTRRIDSFLAVTDYMKSRDDKLEQYLCNLSLIIASGESKKLRTFISPDMINAPLTTACRGGHIDLARELIKVGADINTQDRNGTPLIAACQGGHLNIVMELIKNDAKINLQGNYETPLIAACNGNHANVVMKLLNAGADVNQMTKCDERSFGLRLAFTLRNEYTTALGATCSHGYMSLTQELLKAGAEINPQSSNDSPLTYACKGGHLSLVKELINLGADVNPKNKYQTPLTAACFSGQVQVVTELLDAGADVTLETLHHVTPVKAAIEDQLSNALCIKVGADINTQDRNGTPLIAACQGGHLNIVMELIKNDAKINLQGNKMCL